MSNDIEPTAAPEAVETITEDDLPTLLAEATAAYSQKHYRDAAELYSRATELQAEENGEMSTENAELLYLYGRCLYHVAVEKSDVLGEKVAGEKPKEKSTKKAQADGETETTEKRIAEEGVAAIVNGDTDASKAEQDKPTATKPFFQFTGDENFDQSDEEEEQADGEAEGQDQEEDEFMNAFEILDLARVLLQRRLEELQADSDDKGKTTTPSETISQVKERLADTHDLQAEISLEGEQFLAAVNDLRSALVIKQELYPPESSFLAELHFKLSLALEFGSVTQPKGADGEVDQSKVATVDEAMREEAAKEMESAISSCKLRIAKEESALKEGKEITLPGRKEKITQKSVDDVKEMVADMEQRLVELRQAPVSINDPRGTGALDGATPLNGILGAILGESAEQQKKRLEDATKDAKDITGLVRKKKPTAATESSSGPAASTANGIVSNGHPVPAPASTPSVVAADSKIGTKRKIETAEDEVSETGSGKKARVEDVEEDS